MICRQHGQTITDSYAYENIGVIKDLNILAFKRFARDQGAEALHKLTIMSMVILLRSSIFTLELSQKFDFQPSTIKPDSIGHPTVEIGQIWPLGWFWRWFAFF